MNKKNRYIVRWKQVGYSGSSSYLGTDTVYANSNKEVVDETKKLVEERHGFNPEQVEVTEAFIIKPIKL